MTPSTSPPSNTRVIRLYRRYLTFAIIFTSFCAAGWQTTVSRRPYFVQDLVPSPFPVSCEDLELHFSSRIGLGSPVSPSHTSSTPLLSSRTSAHQHHTNFLTWYLTVRSGHVPCHTWIYSVQVQILNFYIHWPRTRLHHCVLLASGYLKCNLERCEKSSPRSD